MGAGAVARDDPELNRIGNERLRRTNVKSEATLHLKSAERKRVNRFWDLTMQRAGVACRQDSTWFLTMHDASDPLAVPRRGVMERGEGCPRRE